VKGKGKAKPFDFPRPMVAKDTPRSAESQAFWDALRAALTEGGASRPECEQRLFGMLCFWLGSMAELHRDDNNTAIMLDSLSKALYWAGVSVYISVAVDEPLEAPEPETVQ
jgi:hypothetical protein